MGLTAAGLGSGLDVKSLVSQLMSVERQPLTALATKEASFQSRLSAFGQIKSSLAALQTAAKALNDPAKFSATKATVATDAGFSASTGSAAAAGSYGVTVEQLAKSQRVATSATASFIPGDGRTEPKTLEIRFGKVIDGAFVPGEPADGTFTPDAGEAKTLEFKGSTIEDLRDAINKGDLGVTASLIDNGSAKQLVITSKNTGADQAFRIGGTVGLAYDPSAPTASPSTYRVQASQDARVNIDGITITRSSNTIDNAIDGVTLTLAKETTTAGSLTVTADYSGARSAIDAFVKAYNDTQSTLKNLTAYDADTKTSAALTGDSTARSLQNQLRSLVGGALSGLGSTQRLADIGITFDKDGKLSVSDGAKLDAALKDPQRNVAAFFAGSGDTKGLAATVADGLKSYLDSGGLLAGRTDGINASIKSIAKQREALQARLDKVEQRYTAQFTALDSVLSSMTQTSTYLTQQLSRLP